jgi:hypothetical protein
VDLTLLVVLLVSALKQLVLVVVHPMNRHHSQLVVMLQALVVVLELLVVLEVALVELVRLKNHHLIVLHLVQVMVAELKDFQLVLSAKRVHSKVI